jgi:hypothetical protein
MLLDPFEEEFHLPSDLVNLSDCKCRKREVVCQKLEPLSGFHIQIVMTVEAFTRLASPAAAVTMGIRH